MHLHDINNLINLQDIIITNCSISNDEQLILVVEPVVINRTCPCCHSNEHVILIGVRKTLRSVRHLDCFERQTILLLPMIRLTCTSCEVFFTHQYSFVEERSRYTIPFQRKLANSLTGTTVKHIAKLFDVPYSTCERIVKKHLNTHTPTRQKELLETAVETTKLVLGIDDFAIRKGHRYNTGIHDLKNEALLIVTKGRTFTELIKDTNLLSTLECLKPFAVVMDLARSYHKFCATVFPDAIRIADRFHVNRYMTDAVGAVRRRVSKTLKGISVRFLKQHKQLLEKRNDNLTDKEQNKLVKLLSFSPELAQIYGIKESLIDWYDLSNESNSLKRLQRWIKTAEALKIPELNEALKPFKNWTVEISNYHKCRFTNAAVEGRNNKIKTLQRKCYFLRNRLIYENRIYQECNSYYL